jgi:hypothetical protein
LAVLLFVPNENPPVAGVLEAGAFPNETGTTDVLDGAAEVAVGAVDAAPKVKGAMEPELDMPNEFDPLGTAAVANVWFDVLPKLATDDEVLILAVSLFLAIT